MVAKKPKTEESTIVDGIVCTTAAPLVDIDKLIPYENNARVHGSELEFLKNMIKDPKIGFRDPIEVDGDMIIVSGHGRRQAAIELGMTKVPCLIHKDMHGEASDVYRMTANRASDLSGYDFDKLNFETARLKDLGWDMTTFGFEDMAQFDMGDNTETTDTENIEFITEPDPLVKEEQEYKIMVSLPSKEAQDELFEDLVRKGYNCQIL